MIKILIKKFINDYKNTEDKGVREAYSVLGGILGILCNMLLFGVKLTIGTIMNSIAITSDAFNNLSDTGSSLIAIIGAKMSNRRPDKEHPFGHGRIEYISSLIVSFLIMVVGLELLKSSFDKVLHPQKVVLNPVLLLILVLSVLVKVWMYSYNRYIGKVIGSGVIRATAFDSFNDVIATSAVILSTLIGHFINFSVDGIVGLIVSGMIIYTGFGISKDTVSILLGNPPSAEMVKKINDIIMESTGIVGVHDLIVHDYGPGRVIASVHAEVPDDAGMIKVHEVIDETEHKIFQELGIHIVIHMDPISVNCEKTEQLRSMVIDIVKGLNQCFSIHDFRLTDGENHINLIFDLAVPCDLPQDARETAVKTISEKLSEIDSRFHAVIEVDDSF